jgi:hypothetical protein
MMWRNHSDGVPDILIDNTSILSEGAGDAALRLRRRFMRTGYVPRDVPESATNVSLEYLNNLIRTLNFTQSDSDIIEGTMSHTTDEDKSSFTDDLSDSGPLIYIPSLTIVDDDDEMVEEYREHDIPGEFLVCLSHNLLDVTTEDIKQFVAIHALKQMSIFQEVVATESDNETLQDSDEWILSDNSVSLDSDDEIINDSDHESDEHSVEVAEQNVDRVEIQPDSNVPVWKRTETIEDEIAIEQGKKLVATYSDKSAEDIDPLWFLLVFADCFPNAQGLAGNNVYVKRWLSYLIQIDGSRLFSIKCFCLCCR